MLPPFIDKSQCHKRTIFAGVDIYTAAANEMMLSLVEFQPHAVVEEHSHPHEQVGIVLGGEATFYIGDERREMRVGDMYRIAGGVKHKVVAGAAGAQALDVFHPIRQDYLGPGPG
jgi:quercetin dioxygenase-like cupin family protein